MNNATVRLDWSFRACEQPGVWGFDSQPEITIGGVGNSRFGVTRANYLSNPPAVLWTVSKEIKPLLFQVDSILGLMSSMFNLLCVGAISGCWVLLIRHPSWLVNGHGNQQIPWWQMFCGWLLSKHSADVQIIHECNANSIMWLYGVCFCHSVMVPCECSIVDL